MRWRRAAVVVMVVLWGSFSLVCLYFLVRWVSSVVEALVS